AACLMADARGLLRRKRQVPGVLAHGLRRLERNRAGCTSPLASGQPERAYCPVWGRDIDLRTVKPAAFRAQNAYLQLDVPADRYLGRQRTLDLDTRRMRLRLRRQIGHAVLCGAVGRVPRGDATEHKTPGKSVL